MDVKQAGQQTSENVKPRRHRLQLDFSSEAYERLNRIREMSDAATNAEVVRNALRLYDWFLEQKRNNSRIQVVDNDTIKEIEILF